jgi:GntR family transcriptional regulator, transcriptional repressor for pyruvate dehydrogenase complex
VNQDFDIATLEREPKLADRVTQQLQGLVVNGQFSPGDRLPSERELGDRFGVSRTVVREAVRALVAKGLLEVRPGSGTVIRALTTESAVESMSLLLRQRSRRLDYAQVVEVRRLLEVEIAGLAAERRSDSDIETMEEVLRQAKERLDDPDNFINTDIAFHAALAQATQNELFVVLLDSIADVMVEVRRLGLGVPGTPARALGYHRSILACVRVGDVEGARQAMYRHMDEARDTMRQAVDGQGR